MYAVGTVVGGAVRSNEGDLVMVMEAAEGALVGSGKGAKDGCCVGATVGESVSPGSFGTSQIVHGYVVPRMQHSFARSHSSSAAPAFRRHAAFAARQARPVCVVWSAGPLPMQGGGVCVGERGLGLSAGCCAGASVPGASVTTGTGVLCFGSAVGVSVANSVGPSVGPVVVGNSVGSSVVAVGLVDGASRIASADDAPGVGGCLRAWHKRKFAS